MDRVQSCIDLLRDSTRPRLSSLLSFPANQASHETSDWRVKLVNCQGLQQLYVVHNQWVHKH